METNIKLINARVMKKAVRYKHGPTQNCFSVTTSPSIHVNSDSLHGQNRFLTTLVPFPQVAEHSDS